VESQISDCEKQLEALLYPSAERDLLKTIPCVGKILSAVIALEVGDVRRFSSAGQLVSYAGLVPSARESAERKRQGRCPRDCNVHLKWAFVEAANLIACKQKNWPEQHAVRLYQRVKQSTKMHGKATMAVARHLAEASYWILSKQEVYREPKQNAARSFVDARVSAN
jgi:transposase